MNQQLFLQACQQAKEAQGGGGGIGTLGEGILHSAIKFYLEPYQGSHEIKVGRYVADIVGEEGVVEIQTRHLYKLRPKLQAFLEVSRVTVVYPIAGRKWLSWMDPETGEVVSRRKSPKQGTAADAFYELYRIKDLLSHPHLRIRLLLLEVEDIRYLNGWSTDKKRGSSRAFRIPTGLLDEVEIACGADYYQLLPPGLPTAFTTRDFAKAGRLHLSAGQAAVNVLHHLELIRRIGKQGRLYLYQLPE